MKLPLYSGYASWSIRTRTLWALCKGTMGWRVWHFPGVGLGTCTTGVVLAPEVQPGPHQVKALSMGLMFLSFFATPAKSQVPILQLGMLEQWG